MCIYHMCRCVYIYALAYLHVAYRNITNIIIHTWPKIRPLLTINYDDGM